MTSEAPLAAETRQLVFPVSFTPAAVQGSPLPAPSAPPPRGALGGRREPELHCFRLKRAIPVPAADWLEPARASAPHSTRRGVDVTF